MKRILPFLAGLLLASCNSNPKLSLTLSNSDISSGKMMLTQYNETVLTQPVKDGKASIEQPLQSPGYYDIVLIDDTKPLNSKKKFTLYLENTNYLIEPQNNNYPKVISGSKTQQQLTDYYQLQNQMAGKLDAKIDSMTKYLESQEVKNMPPKQRAGLYEKTRKLQTERRKLEPEILTNYLEAHPNSLAASHILAEQYLDEYASQYAAVYARLSDSAKNTDDGIKVGNKVAVLVKLLPGATAADIKGQTPDGKAFNHHDIKAKVILVEFWKSGSVVAEQNHAKMSNGLIITPRDREQFATISVSLDTDKATWLKNSPKNTAKWIQVTDLKGNASANVTNWKIKAVPTYFLLDGNWKLLQANINLIDVDQAVHDYLNKK